MNTWELLSTEAMLPNTLHDGVFLGPVTCLYPTITLLLEAHFTDRKTRLGKDRGLARITQPVTGRVRTGAQSCLASPSTVFPRMSLSLALQETLPPTPRGSISLGPRKRHNHQVGMLKVV